MTTVFGDTFYLLALLDSREEYPRTILMEHEHAANRSSFFYCLPEDVTMHDAERIKLSLLQPDETLQT